MQIVVLGMHRSGTSALTRLINLMGAYVGVEGSLIEPVEDNRKGYWERGDVNTLHQELLSAVGADWYKVSQFDLDLLPAEQRSTFTAKAGKIVHKLEAHRPWVLKDPRLCLLLPLWRELLEVPVYVHIYRSPLQVAQSLHTRDGFPIRFGIALWEQYNLAALSHTRGFPRLLVSHQDLIERPVKTVQTLHKELVALGVPRLRCPSKREIASFIDPGLYHERGEAQQEKQFINQAQAKLLRALRKRRVLEWKSLPALSEGAREALVEHEALEEQVKFHCSVQTALEAKTSEVAHLTSEVAHLTSEVAHLTSEVAHLREELQTSEQAATTEREAIIAAFHNSNSWRMTAPLRATRRAWQMIVWRGRGLLSRTARTIYRRAPLSFATKVRIKESLFRLAPLLFRHTVAYREWTIDRQDMDVDARRPQAVLPPSMPRVKVETKSSTNAPKALEKPDPETLSERSNILPESDTKESFVPYRRNKPLSSPVKVIAFYLPQYHPFPENDEWWGKGFMDWTNVTKAAPSFLGHHQPHHPIHFGYYDLRVPEVMEEQATLAKEYGISGFSYYFYWFDGKVLMETPLEQMLANSAVDMPFCLTWANENWTRRWDGLDNEILIAQNHGRQDSIAFIKYIDKYFKDDRYIRVEGKPLLIVYRAAAIPDIREIAELWRYEARKLGWPGLYLAAVQSFGITDPSVFDFDAAVQFPPHGLWTRTQEIAEEVAFTRKDFVGYVRDYRQAGIALAEKEPPYKLFRTAMLSWDNTARHQNRATIFHNFSLDDYGTWLEDIVNYVLKNEKYQADEKLVFVNAWNEWAEGTHLEPDQKYGYGYLQATYDAIDRATSTDIVAQPRVSVIVPNYNHEQFLEQRLDSIYSQSFTDFEVIILDDASTDRSLGIIARYQDKFPNKTRVIRNQANSGNVFLQWLAGLDLAEGDLVWIAESDDLSDRDFLGHMVAAFSDEAVLLAYGDIQYVDNDGRFVPGITDYLTSTGFDQWNTSYKKSSWHEFNGSFGVKNIIANVSGAVFRRPRLSASERDTLVNFKVCGDWYLYSLLAKGGYISFVKEAKSFFRLHHDSTSRKAYGEEWFYREHFEVLREIKKTYDVPRTTIEQHFCHLKKLFDVYMDSACSSLDELFPCTVLFNDQGKSLRVCIASIGFYLGGGEIVPIDLANGLRAAGHSVTFFASGWEEGQFSQEVRKRLHGDIPVCYRHDLRGSFQELQQELGFQIINTHNIGVDLFLFDNSYKPTGPWVVTQHGSYETSVQDLSKAFVGFLKQSVGHWAVVAEKNKAPLISRGVDPTAFSHIPNGICRPEHTSNDLRESMRQELDIRAEAFVFVIASRAIPEKGWEHAIHALATARERTNKNLYLLLIGEGPETDRLRNTNVDKHYLRFLGLQAGVPRFIAASDAGIFPTFYEGESFPLFVAECLTQAIPVITSDVGECRKMMSNDAGEIAGIIVEPKRSTATFERDITDAVVHLTDSESTYQQACFVAGTLSKNFSMEKTVQSYAELFATLLGKRRNAHADIERIGSTEGGVTIDG